MERIFFCGECRKFFVEECDELVYACKCKHCGSEATITCDRNKKDYDTYSEFNKSLFKDTIKAKYPNLESVTAQHQRIADRQEQERRQAEKNRELDRMLITSGFNLEGYRIVKYSGYISGDDALSMNRGYPGEDISLSAKLMISLPEIRRNALRELKEAAYALGCNAVIGVDFDYITLDPQTVDRVGTLVYQPYVFCVTANGNAVVIEKNED